MDTRLQNPTQVMRIAVGLMATLAGLDKFFNILVGDTFRKSRPVAAAAKVMVNVRLTRPSTNAIHQRACEQHPEWTRQPRKSGTRCRANVRGRTRHSGS